MPELTRYAVEQWIRAIATGEFHYTKVLNGQVAPELYDKLRKIMFDICHAQNPCCESVGRKDGYYRPIAEVPHPISWQEAPTKTAFPIKLPFDLHELVFIYPNTAIVIAGSKSSGKTGFLYRTVVLNMNEVNTILLSNMEGGENQMRDRFDAMDIEIPSPAPFKVYHITDNYHDFIKEPNTLYVIDYIDVPEGIDFYLIGAAISKVRKKLQNSVAVIGLQKPRSRDIAYGGEQTLKDTTLYLAMNTSKLKIVDAKVPATPNLHPKNMQWTFKYDEAGTKFLNPQRFYGEEFEGG